MTRPETVDVFVVVHPDGSTYWTDDLSPEQIRASVERWEATRSPEQREKYIAAGVMGGVVKLRMLREDYERLPATNESAVVDKAAKGAK